MSMGTLLERLERATRFVEAAEVFCGDAVGHAPDRCCLLLHSEAGPPVVMADNDPAVPDEYRIKTGPSRLNWDQNPMMIELRARVAAIVADEIDVSMFSMFREHGYNGPDLYHCALPLIGEGGWFATAVYALGDPISRARERDLMMAVTQMSAWCTTRGIAAMPSFTDRRLSPREYEIAALTTSGRTNAEIADVLGISVSTVKVRLKQAFDRLGIDSREELARVMRRLAPLEGVPIGISSFKSVKITRADHTLPWVPEAWPPTSAA